MNLKEINEILASANYPHAAVSAAQLHREEDDSLYDVWRVETGQAALALKAVSLQEEAVYQAFFPHGAPGVPEVFGFAQSGEQRYLLMEFFPGKSLCQSSRERLTLALDALIGLQEQFWGNTELAGAGCTFEKKYADESRRLSYMEELSGVYQAYLAASEVVPRTLCNDDLLPFNVLVSETAQRAVILDWEYGGILPYPCALARLLAFGEEGSDFMFQMSRQDKEYAVRYYYDRLVRRMGIPWKEYIHTLKLFFFKEYSEWVYLGRKSGDPLQPY